MNPVFADTYYFLALLNRGDAAHGKALAVAQEITNPIVTTAWVLTEVGDALSALNFRPLFSQFLETLRSDPASTIVPPNTAQFEAGIRLYAERPDKEWTLTDCISFEVMRELGITEALTGDRHFQQAGFTVLLG